MAWPTTPVAVGELISASQLNGLPVRVADTTLSAAAAFIELTAIPAHYAHLLLELCLRGDAAAVATNAILRFNGDSGLNYDFQLVRGSAAAVTAAESLAASFALAGEAPAGTAGANLFAASTVEVPDYANAVNNKACHALCARKDGGATGNLHNITIANFWRSNAAINKITILPGAGNWVAGSRATLYALP